MQLDVKRKFLVRSDRVKAIDFHANEPWVITSLYSGEILLWSLKSQEVIRTFEVTDVPIRACKFIEQKNWVICGADDFQIRVYNYNTLERVASFEAHPDYIRAIVIHPSQPYVLTCSDDMTVKCWNWENDWSLVQTYESHNHFVMALAINPKDTNTFASACLDKTVKIWSFGSSAPNYTLDAHDRGVNFVSYFQGGEKPYLLSSGDDNLIKIWDYQNKSCVRTLEGHSDNVSFAIFHPQLPLIISGSEDGSLKVWNSTTFKLEETFKYGLERAWAVAYRSNSNLIAIGFDEGSVVLSLGNEEPRASMDNNGKIVWAKNFDIQQCVIDKLPEDIEDGAIVHLPVKEAFTCGDFPSQIIHSPNGRFITILGDGEYTIYTSLAWRNKAFGTAQSFVWSSDSNEYAIRETTNTIKVFRFFKEKPGLTPNFGVEEIFGGPLLALRGRNWVCFYSWDDGEMLQRIDVHPLRIIWSDNGELLTIICDGHFYLLKFNFDSTDDSDCFSVITEISESIMNGQWIGDCFIYTTSSNRLNYIIGSSVNSLSHYEQSLYLLGYHAKSQRIFLQDKNLNLVSFSINISVIEYQSLVLRNDLNKAREKLAEIPDLHRGKIAHFMELLGYKEIALEITSDSDYKFELALSLNKLDIAYEIAKKSQKALHWKSLGDAAIKYWDLAMACECYTKAEDLGSLFLILSSVGDKEGLKLLAKKCEDNNLFNYAFMAYFSLSDIERCSYLLEKSERFSEACFLQRTYSKFDNKYNVTAWKNFLERCSKHVLAARLLNITNDTEISNLEKNMSEDNINDKKNHPEDISVGFRTLEL